MAVYDDTPVGEVCRAVASASFPIPGDPRKMAQAMIDSVGMTRAPRRLVFGSRSYTRIHQLLTERLAALEAQKDIAESTEADD